MLLRHYYKLIFIFCLFAIATRAQSLTADPNYGYLGKWEPVSIKGTRTHFAYKRQTVTLQFIGNSKILGIKDFTIVNDSLITCRLALPSNIPVTNYRIVVHDDIDGDVLNNNDYMVYNPGKAECTASPANMRKGIKNLPMYIIGYNTWFSFPVGKLKVWLQKGNDSINTDVAPGYTVTFAKVYPHITPNTPVGVYYVFVQDSFDNTVQTDYPVTITSDALPGILSVNPDTATRGTFSRLEVTGINCTFANPVPGKTLALLTNGQDTILSGGQGTFGSDKVTCYFNIPYHVQAGNYDLVITDEDDGELKSAASVRIIKNKDRKILSHEPQFAYPGAMFSMLVSATNTNFASGSTRVWLSQGGVKIIPQSLHILDNESLYAYFILSDNMLISSGVWSLNIDDGIGPALSIAKAFTILYPEVATIISAEPDTLQRGVQTSLRIKGLKTNFTPNSKFYFYNAAMGYTYAENDQIISPTEMIIRITPDQNLASGPVTLYYNEANIFTSLFNPMYIIDHSGTGMPDVDIKTTCSIYPNPFKNGFTLSYRLEKPSNVSIDVFDMMGRQVMVQDAGMQPAGPHERLINLPANNMATGIYLLRIKAGEDKAQQKIIKTK